MSRVSFVSQAHLEHVATACWRSLPSSPPELATDLLKAVVRLCYATGVGCSNVERIVREIGSDLYRERIFLPTGAPSTPTQLEPLMATIPANLADAACLILALGMELELDPAELVCKRLDEVGDPLAIAEGL